MSDVSSGTLPPKAECYFSSMSSMASRILVDAATIRGKSGNEWKAMPFSKQCEVITEGLIPQTVKAKYAYYPQSKPDAESFPKLQVASGEKYVVDEDSQGKGSGYTWRDEHSGPFTWETQSQLDLSFDQRPAVPPPSMRQSAPRVKGGVPVLPGLIADLAPPLIASRTLKKAPAPPIIPADASRASTGVEPSRLHEIKKPTSPPPPVPPKASSAVGAVVVPVRVARREKDQEELALAVDLSSPSNSSMNGDIPKTGFDFLDNW